MRIRGVWVVLVALLVAAPAAAHEHKMDLYGAFSAESGSLLIGAHGTVNVPVHKDSRGVKDLSLVGDVSVHGGDDDKRKSNVLGGVRYTYARSTAQKHLPFVQVLFGTAENKTSAGSDWDGAVGLGAGFDSVIGNDGHAAWGFRAEADYIRHGGADTARVSIGFFKRWKD